jgi:hypothetical protein
MRWCGIQRQSPTRCARGTLRAFLDEDRGDDVRGPVPRAGKEAVTHLDALERLRCFALVGWA